MSDYESEEELPQKGPQLPPSNNFCRSVSQSKTITTRVEVRYGLLCYVNDHVWAPMQQLINTITNVVESENPFKEIEEQLMDLSAVRKVSETSFFA